MFKKAIALRQGDYDGFAELFCRLYDFKIISTHTGCNLSDVGYDLTLDIDTDLMLRNEGKDKHWAQLNVVMTQKDEALFDTYLKQNYEFMYIRASFTLLSNAYMQSLGVPAAELNRVYIWNKEFKFEPEIHPFHDDSLRYYLGRIDAPIVELKRSHRGGRRFYESIFAVFPKRNNITFSKSRFIAFYEDLESWIKSNSAGYILMGCKTYFLPDAWSDYLKNPDNYL